MDRIESMASTAMSLGHEYVVQTDHSARLTIAHGLNEERLSNQLDQIDEINAAIAEAGHDFRVHSGMEVDILEDGALDLSDVRDALLVFPQVHAKNEGRHAVAAPGNYSFIPPPFSIFFILTWRSP